MRIAFAIVVASFGLFACGCAPLSADDDSDRAAKAVAAQKPRGTKSESERAAKAPTVRRMKALTFDDYIDQRKPRDAAMRKVAVDPRWEFSPRQVLQSLGNVRLFYAVAPTDTGAKDLHGVNEKPPHHFGLTVWDVKTKNNQARLKVTCLRLVSCAGDAAPAVPPTAWSSKLGSGIYSKDRILDTRNVRICGNVVRLTNYVPYGQCNVPFRECWNVDFVAGGWAVYLTSSFDEGSNAKAAAFDIVRAADLITNALRTAKVSLGRPEFKFDKFGGIQWGNQEATFVFSLESTRGKEICANLWHMVPREYSSTGIKGSATRIIEVGGEGRLHSEVTTGTYIMRGKAFQLDWANEFGVGGSTLHSLTPMPFLIEDLKDDQVQVRIDAVFALGRIGLPAVPALMGAVQDKNGRVRRVAAITLGRIGPAAKDAVPALIGVLKDKDKNVRYPAVVALTRIGPAAKEAIPALKVLRERDFESRVRRGAAWALKRIGDENE